MKYRRKFFHQMGLLLAGAGSRLQASAPQSNSDARSSGGTQTSSIGAASEVPIRGDFDLIVVGGGISGTCAAISAARHGLKVALVHERSMLGGNSSSEVKLFPENNSGSQPWIREGGIHDEFHTEERVRNHQDYMEGTMNAHWDLVLYEWAIREKNLKLFLNSHMHRAIMDGPRRIRAIQAIQLGTEKSFELHAPLFVDATGDGVLGYRAGADFRWGREARSEYGEAEAPETADEKLMGNTLFFRAIDTGRPVPFQRPKWAAEFATETDLTSRGHSYIQGGYWWIEVGAPLHPIKNNEEIRHEALRQLLGVWDHIKNKGDHGARNYGLEFVGFWPYKRECRRILGDYVLTQKHVQDPTALADAVAHGAWGIDIHVQRGILARSQEPYPPPHMEKNFDKLGTMVYPIPLRALYSRSVENLFMAGRPISGSYVAFASTRVLSTGANVGQAVGVAAALASKYQVTPREVAAKHVKECQQILLRHDVHIPGVVNEDTNDLARAATVSASSECLLEFPEAETGLELKHPHAQIFPVSGGRIDAVELHLESRRSTAEKVKLGLRPAANAGDFRASADIAVAEALVAPGTGWARFPLNVNVKPGQLYYVHVDAHPGILWRRFKEADGAPNRCPVAVTAADLPGKTRWRPLTMGQSLSMRVAPQPQPYSASNVNRGTHRPDAWTNIWISDPNLGLPAWVELKWAAPVALSSVQLTFDTDANRRVTLPLFRYPDCVKDYVVQCWVNGDWRTVAASLGNYARRREHRFPQTATDRLRVLVTATNGARSARIYEVRAYNES